MIGPPPSKSDTRTMSCVHCDEDNTRTEGQEKNTYSGYTFAKLVRETKDGVTAVCGIDDYTGDRMELFCYNETK